MKLINANMSKQDLDGFAQMVCKLDKANTKGKPEFNMGRARKAVKLVLEAMAHPDVLRIVKVEELTVGYVFPVKVKNGKPKSA